MTIASLIVDVAANTVKLQKDVQEIHGAMDRISSVAGTVGKALAAAFTVTALVQMGKQVIDFASHLTDLSAKTGLSTTALQKLGAVFEESGVSMDAATSAALKLQKGIGGDDKGLSSLVGKLGLSFADLKQMAPEDAFFTIADAIGRIPNQNEKALASTIAFGKGGMELLAGLNGHLKETAHEFESMGLIIDEKTIKAADDFGDQLGMMGKQLLGIVASIVGPLLPALSGLGNILMWLGQNVIGPVFNVAVKSVMTVLGLFWEGLSALLGKLAELGTHIPIVGKHLGFLKDASDWLGKSSQQTTAYLEGLWKHTETTGTTAQTAAPKLLGLGGAAETASKAMADASKRALELARSVEDVDYVAAKTTNRIDALNAVFSENFLRVPPTIPQLVGGLEQIGVAGERALLPARQLGIVIPTIAGASGQAAAHVRTLTDSLQSLKAGDFGAVFKDIGNFLKGGLGKIGTGFLEGIGNSLLGGVSSLIGKGISAIGKAIGNLFNGEAKKVNNMRDEFQKLTFGSFPAMALAANKAGYELKRLLDASTVKSYTAEMEKFKAAIAFQQGAVSELDSVFQKYNITMGNAGTAGAQRIAAKTAGDFYHDIELLRGAGMSLSNIFDTDLGPAMKGFVEEARAAGVALPEQFREYSQHLLDTGQLLDANGQAFSSLEEAGLSFGGAIQDTFKEITKSVQALVAAIKLDLGLALTGAERDALNLQNAMSSIPPPPAFGSGNVFGDLKEGAVPMAAGGFGMVSKPTLFLAGEAGAEEVAFSGAGKRFGGGGSSTTINIHSPTVRSDGDITALAQAVKQALDDDYRRKNRVRAA